MLSLGKCSRNNILETFKRWDVPKDFADTMYNYVVYGFNPGSCFTAVLANDFHRAIGSSHSANTVNSFKSLSGWITEFLPTEAHGSYQAINNWSKLDDKQRRAVLEHNDLIFTLEDEMMLVLQGEHTDEPVLY